MASLMLAVASLLGRKRPARGQGWGREEEVALLERHLQQFQNKFGELG